MEDDNKAGEVFQDRETDQDAKKPAEDVQEKGSKPSKPRANRSRNRGSTLDADHGVSTMKVYPVTEASMNLLKTNSKNASRQYSSVAASLSIAASILVDFVFSATPTPTMKALVIIGPVVCFLVACIQWVSAKESITSANDEWTRIEQNTKFQSFTTGSE